MAFKIGDRVEVDTGVGWRPAQVVSVSVFGSVRYYDLTEPSGQFWLQMTERQVRAVASPAVAPFQPGDKVEVQISPGLWSSGGVLKSAVYGSGLGYEVIVLGSKFLVSDKDVRALQPAVPATTPTWPASVTVSPTATIAPLTTTKFKPSDQIEVTTDAGISWVAAELVAFVKRNMFGVELYEVVLADGTIIKFVPESEIRSKLRHPTSKPITPPKKILHDACPKCGDAGEWRSLALVCRAGHGIFAG